jgi:hypothetical protein
MTEIAMRKNGANNSTFLEDGPAQMDMSHDQVAPVDFAKKFFRIRQSFYSSLGAGDHGFPPGANARQLLFIKGLCA